MRKVKYHVCFKEHCRRRLKKRGEGNGWKEVKVGGVGLSEVQESEGASIHRVMTVLSPMKVSKKMQCKIF